jgi:hypothetical protein
VHQVSMLDCSIVSVFIDGGGRWRFERVALCIQGIEIWAFMSLEIQKG